VRVALDTNVLVSAFTTRGLCADLFQALLADHVTIVSETVLAELATVLREKFRHPADAAAERTEFLRQFCELAPARDPPDLDGIDLADRTVIGEAIAGAADALVTGDQAMLALRSVDGLPVLSPRRLWDALRQGGRKEQPA
jgi:putative PIN family toxin of toxin-antitoxin system